MTLNTDYPAITPSQRSYSEGDWPIGYYKSINGQEVRILFGSRRTGHTLTLEYKSIPDTTADAFLDDYRNKLGTFTAWSFDPATNKPAVFGGWTGGDTGTIQGGTENRWRYAAPPVIKSLRPGYSDVSIKLVAVLIDQP